MREAQWIEVLPRVLMWRDSCNVYAIVGESETLIVDCGTGQWLDHIAELPKPPAAIAITHFFRDHSAGAVRAAREFGLQVFVPEGEEAILRDPVRHLQNRQSYLTYRNYWDHFAPIEAVPVSGVLRDYERLTLAGIPIEVLPLPGATVTQVGLAFAIPGTNLRAVCVGETIHSPGKVSRVAPLQYNYNDLTGAVNVFRSASALRNRGVDVLLPSLGTPLLEACESGLRELESSMASLCAGRPVEAGMLAEDGQPELTQVTEHVWQASRTFSAAWFVASGSGKVLAIDYGYHGSVAIQSLNYSSPYRSRPLLHTLDALQDKLGIARIDVVIPSHFHDDHVAGIPLIQRLHGTECWASDSFADLIEQPSMHAFPCNFPSPIRVDRRIKEAEIVSWEGVDFNFAPMSGHTRFASLIGFEVDGVRFAHTGDQYFFLDVVDLERDVIQWPPMSAPIREWTDKFVFQNHVYRNGALLDGYKQSGTWLREWRPDIVISGHQPPFMTNEDFFGLVDRYGGAYQRVHRDAMPLGDGDAHFDIDSWAGWLWPYRLHIQTGERAVVRATVRNPFPTTTELRVHLVGPVGWEGSAATLLAAPRAEVSCLLEITPTGECWRQPIAVELEAAGRPFGQIAEALVTVGGSSW